MKYSAACVALALALTACKDDTLTDFVVSEAQKLPVKASWAAALGTIGPTAQAGGTLELDEYGSYMLLDVAVQGLHADSTYQWRLFFGTCSDRIAYYGPNASPPAYRPFTADASGAATSEATVAGRLKADSTYSARVFIPRTNPTDTTFYACGNLQRK